MDKCKRANKGGIGKRDGAGAKRLTGPAAIEAFGRDLERGGWIPDYPFKQCRTAWRKPLTANENALLKQVREFVKADHDTTTLNALRGFLRSECNIQNPDELGWGEILWHIQKQFERPQKKDEALRAVTGLDGKFSKPMSKVAIMSKLGCGLRGYRKLKTIEKDHPIIPVGESGQLWMIRYDKMPLNWQDKFR